MSAISAFRLARPTSGDLVDRCLESNLRRALFGAQTHLLLGRLQVEGFLGSGGMGTLLSAFDPVLDRHVAVKGLLPDATNDTEQLLQEARMLAKLEHPNVVSIYDVLQENDTVYLVMEQVRGANLRMWFSQTRTWKEVVSLFVNIGRGLAAAHALQIAHCDVKPENVVVSEDGPRLIDFGLAHQHDNASSRGGTRAYLAPERALGAPGSAAADQYAFFTMLVEAIEGKRPSPEEEHQSWSSMPHRLKIVALRGLHRDPARRYEGMDKAVHALEASLKDRRPIATVGVLSLAVVATGLAFFGTTADEASVCQGAEAKLANIWNATTRDTMERAFLANKIVDGSHYWAKVEPKLDEYAREWVDLRTQSCVATRVHKEQSEELMELSMFCLDRNLLAFAGTTQLLTDTPHEQTIENAIKTVGELPAVNRCVDPTSLRQTVPLPDGQNERSLLRKQQERLEALNTLRHQGSFKEALKQSEALKTDAEALGYPPMVTDSLLAHGDLQMELGQWKAAETTFRQAASAAAKAHDDGKNAEVWIRVLNLLVKEGRLKEADVLKTVAITSADRVPTNHRVQSKLQRALGVMYDTMHLVPQAAAALEKNLFIQREHGDSKIELIRAMSLVATMKAKMGNYIGASEELQTVLEMNIGLLGPEHPSVAAANMSLAEVLARLGKEEEAVSHFKESIRIWAKRFGPEHEKLAFAYLPLADIDLRRGNIAAARHNISKALQIRERQLGPKHGLILETLTIAAHIELTQDTEQNLRAAEKIIFRMTDLLDDLGSEADRYAVFALEVRALFSERKGDLHAALDDRQRALAQRIAKLGKTHPETAYSYGDVGWTLFLQGQFKEAEKNYRKAGEILDLHPSADPLYRIEVQLRRGTILSRQGLQSAAVTLLQDALTQAVEANDPDLLHQARYALASTLYPAPNTTNDLSRAEMLLLTGELDKALKLTRRFNSKRTNKKNYVLQAQIHCLRQDLKGANAALTLVERRARRSVRRFCKDVNLELQ